MSNSIQVIADQLRATNFEHVRAIIEPDDVMVLIAFLEAMGYLSSEGIVALEAQASEHTGAYYTFLQSKGLVIDSAPGLLGNDDHHAAHRSEYVRWLATEDGIKAVEAEHAAALKVEADAAKAEAKAEKAEAKAAKASKK